MGAIYSKTKVSLSEDNDIDLNGPLTRIRVLPEAESAPVVQDVVLPTDAVASKNTLLAFIAALPLMEMLPNHDLVVDSIRLFSENAAAPDGLIPTKSEIDDVQFGLPLDLVWMKKTRSLIVIAAVLKGHAEIETSSEAVYEAGGLKTSVTDDNKNGDDEEKGHGSIGNGDKGKGDLTRAESDVTDWKGKGKEKEKKEEEDGEDGRSTIGNSQGTAAAEQDRKGLAQMQKDAKASMEAPTVEDSSPQDSPPSQKDLQESGLGHDEHGFRQPRSQNLQYQSTNKRKEGQAEPVVGTEANPGPSSRASAAPDPFGIPGVIFQSKSATEIPVIGKDLEKDVEKLPDKKLQQQLQNALTTSLSNRGKPTSSKSPSFKLPSFSTSSIQDTGATKLANITTGRDEAQVDRTSGHATSQRADYPQGKKLHRSTGSASIVHDSESALPPRASQSQ